MAKPTQEDQSTRGGRGGRGSCGGRGSRGGRGGQRRVTIADSDNEIITPLPGGALQTQFQIPIQPAG